MEKQLKVMKYRSYRLLKEDAQSIPWQGSANFEIPGGRSLDRIASGVTKQSHWL